MFQSNTQEPTAPESADVFQSNTLPGDAAQLIQQLVKLPNSKLPHLAKLLGTSVAQLTADIDALNNLS